MLTVIRKLKDKYLGLIFDYYGMLVDEYVKKFLECSENNDPNAEYWEKKILKYLDRRNDILQERLELRGLG